MDLVIDASVVVKWFVEETGSDRARTLRDDFVAGDLELHAPTILPFEVMNALRFSVVMREERTVQAHLALDAYALRYHPPSGELGRRILHLAYSSDLSVYDASYLALARELGVPLLTADATLAEVGGAGVMRIDEYTSSSAL